MSPSPAEYILERHCAACGYCNCLVLSREQAAFDLYDHEQLWQRTPCVGKGRIVYTFYAEWLLFFAEMIVSCFVSIIKNDAASPCLAAFLTTLKNPKMGLQAKNEKCKQRDDFLHLRPLQNPQMWMQFKA